MGRLLDFLVRYHALFLFLGLEAVCFLLYAQNVDYANAKMFHSANTVTGAVFTKKSNVKYWFGLQAVNDSLNAENSKLRAQLTQSLTIDTVNEYCIEDSLYRQLYTYFPARVINNEVNNRNNYITINRGSKHGIKKDMGVIGLHGIVGKVITVSDEFSVIMSVLHSKFTVSASIEKYNTIGRLHWDGHNPDIVQLEDIASHVELKSGDKILSTGYSALFPEGIEIGTIHQIRNPASSHFLEVDVNLHEDMSVLRYVYVVNYLQRDARGKVENRAISGL
ncbi:MAG: rod shape-determining protein MreC [Limisphaerales bacterium]|jgi:rod shape-determining protein MreC